MPTALEAADILRKHFGFQASPETYIGDPSGAIELSQRRADRQTELEDRVRNDAAAAVIPREGFVPGSPGRRFVSRMDLSNLGSDSADLSQLERDQATDPFTGDAETGRIQKINDTLSAAAMTQRPEIGDAAETVAKRNAFADYMKSRGMKMGEYDAASSPAAQAAAMVPITAQASGPAMDIKDADLKREQALKMSPSLVPGQMPGADGSMGGGLPPNLKPLGATAEKAAASIRTVWPMIGELDSLLDPSANQAPNKLAASAKWALYGMGVAPWDPKDQKKQQLASLISIAGSAPYLAGSRNYQYLKDVQKHLTNPTATDAFLHNQIQELKRRWPQMIDDIITAHVNPGAPLRDLGGPDSDPWASPPTAAETGRRR